MTDVLRAIAQRKRAEVEAARQTVPQHVLVQRALEGVEPRRNLRAALSGRELRLIAEVRRPPAEATAARLMFDPRYVAQEFAGAGAAALAVATDDPEAGSEWFLLRRARRYMALPVIAWDYFVDEYQVYQAWSHDADAVALMVGLVDDDTLQRMVRAAGKLRLTAIIVVRDGFELDSAFAAGATIIAIENRDPGTGRADLSVTERLAQHVPGSVLLIAAHGIVGRGDAERVALAGADAALFEPPQDYELARDAIRDLRGVPAPGRDEAGRRRAPKAAKEE
ncbi:MAG: hypothetical protein AB7Y46_02660 [Armatimonadota bacterium]